MPDPTSKAETTGVPIPTYSAADIDSMFADRDQQIAALQGAVEILQNPPVDPPAVVGGPTPLRSGYSLVYVNELDSLTGINTWDSPAATNAAASPADTGNKELQTPLLAANTLIAADDSASTGSCLQCHVRAGTYALPAGKTAAGLTAARCTIGPQFSLPGALVEVRSKSIGDDGKFAEMIWPASGWHWEHDLRERFPSGPEVSCRHHSDLGKPGGAKPQIITPWKVDPTVWHVYGVEYRTKDAKAVSGMIYTLDGVVLPVQMPDKTVVQEIVDPAWLPATPTSGVISIGSAMPPRRTGRVGYDAADCIDWVQISRAAA